VDLVFGLLFLFPTCFLLIKSSLPFVAHSWAVLERSPDPGGLPARYLLKAVIPVGFILIGLQGISETIKNTYIVLRGKSPSGLG
jgi:TRAP-type mannitol/chloroaromatic compound transport system permease small subunit